MLSSGGEFLSANANRGALATVTAKIIIMAAAKIFFISISTALTKKQRNEPLTIHFFTPGHQNENKILS
jgi:hypothetical protein